MNRRSIYVLSFLAVILLFASRTAPAVPGDAEKYYQQGIRNMQTRQFNKAIQLFGRAVDENPDFKEAWYEMGNAWYNLGNLDKALDSYYVSLDIDKDYRKPLLKIGQIFLKQKKYKMAIFKIKEAQQYYPQNAEIEYLLGRAYEETNNKEGALDSYRKAIALDNDKYGFLDMKIKRMTGEAPPTAPSQAPSPVVSDAPSPEASPDSPPEEPAETPGEAASGSPPLPDELPDSGSRATGAATTPEPAEGRDTAGNLRNSPGPDKTSSPGEPTGVTSSEPTPGEKEAESSKWGKSVKETIKIGSIAALLFVILAGGVYLVAEQVKNSKHTARIMELKDKSKKESPKKKPSEKEIKLSRYSNKRNVIPPLTTQDEEEAEEEEVPGEVVEEMEPEAPAEGENASIEDEHPAQPDSDEEEGEEDEAPPESFSKPDSKYYKEAISSAREERREDSHDPFERLRNMQKKMQMEEELKRAEGARIFKPEKPSTPSKPSKPSSGETGRPRHVDPFVCSCGKIIRDGAYICPRCGKGTR